MKSAKEALEANLETHARHLALSAPFVEKYGDQLPAYLGSLYLGLYKQPVFKVALGHRNSSDRERALALFGDVFGRRGWTGKLSDNGREYDWTREIEGVIVQIEGAESLPLSKTEFAVPPSKFPLQLADAIPA